MKNIIFFVFRSFSLCVYKMCTLDLLFGNCFSESFWYAYVEVLAPPSQHKHKAFANDPMKTKRNAQFVGTDVLMS